MGILGDVLGPVLGYIGAERAEDASHDMAQGSMQFSAGMAREQMQFQERMRGTQYQTAVGDMRAAGLNPMLAYGQGGAGTPTGASASANQSFQPQNSMAAALASAGAVAQLDKVAAEADNIRADTAIKKDEMGADDPEHLPAAYSNRLKKFMGSEAWYKAQTEMRRAELTDAQRDLVMQEIKNAVTRNELDKLDIPKAINEAKAQDSAYMKYIAPYTGELGKITSSATGVANTALRGRMNKYIIHGN